MGELRLVLPTLEYGDQVMAFKQELSLIHI